MGHTRRIAVILGAVDENGHSQSFHDQDDSSIVIMLRGESMLWRRILCQGFNLRLDM